MEALVTEHEPPRRPPRRTKGKRLPVLTPDQLVKLGHAFRLGAPMAVAAGFAGILAAELKECLERGYQGDKHYRELIEAVEQAKALGAINWLVLVEQAAAKDWRAAAWKLTKAYPEVFGDKQVLEHTGADGGPVRVQSETEHKLSVEHKLALPEGVLDDLGRQVAMRMTDEQRKRKAAQTIDVVPEGEPQAVEEVDAAEVEGLIDPDESSEVAT